MKKLKVVTGKQEEVQKDLSEIITGKKLNKFAKFATREAYRTYLFSLNHIDLLQEMTKLGIAPSMEKEFCRNRCLDAYDRAQKPRRVTQIDQKIGSLEEIVRKGTKKS